MVNRRRERMAESENNAVRVLSNQHVFNQLLITANNLHHLKHVGSFIVKCRYIVYSMLINIIKLGSSKTTYSYKYTWRKKKLTQERMCKRLITLLLLFGERIKKEDSLGYCLNGAVQLPSSNLNQFYFHSRLSVLLGFLYIYKMSNCINNILIFVPF